MDEIHHNPEIRFRIPSDLDSFKPYDHQVAAFDALSNHYELAEKRAGMLVIPTGGGKTATASRWLLKNWIRKGGRVLWLAHRQSLLWQAFHSFGEACRLARPEREELGQIIVSGSDRSWSNVSPQHDAVFSTIQTASTERNLGFLSLMVEQSPKGLFVVVDEAHHAAAPSYQRVLKMLCTELGCPVLGLSATPVRMDSDDNRRLWRTFEEPIYEVKKQDLISRKILAVPVPETVKTNVEFERDFTEEDVEHLNRFGELSQRVLERVSQHSGRNKQIVEQYLSKRLQYGKTLLFAVDTYHARTLTMEFEKAGVDADFVDYTRKDNRDVIGAFRDTERPMVLANVEMLTEGVDLPNTQTIFIVRPTRSEALLSQMVGRALRGLQAKGTERAFLVTFVDTWKDFDPLDVTVVIDREDVAEAELRQALPYKLVIVSDELIREAYRLVQSVTKGAFEGIYECLPFGWYTWEAEYEDDLQQRSLLIFENQVKGFEQLDADFASPESVPEHITEPYGRDLVLRYFGDCQDPRPTWVALAEYLDAKRRRAEIMRYTFEEKAEFDPRMLARSIYDRNLGERDKETELAAIFASNPICQHVYQHDNGAFYEDVSRALADLRDTRVPAPVELLEVIPEEVRPWPEGELGYRLGEVWQTVASVKGHFPKGAPRVTDIHYMSKPDTRVFGFFRASDRTIAIHPGLDSPDVPLFAMEFLVYHEGLHADMPGAGHNREFRRRERRFVPSEAAQSDALGRGYKPASTADGWRVLADQFFDTFEKRFAMSRHGKGRRM